jgi:response regulator RpfG family c-di-GMP phosphodiesterase
VDELVAELLAMEQKKVESIGLASPLHPVTS